MTTSPQTLDDDEAPPGSSPAPDADAASVGASIPGPSRPWARVLIPLLLLAVAGTLRFADLSHPDRIYFDETYYANDAQQYLTRGVEEGFAVHPPVAKWMIAAGIELFGFDSFGWRAASAAAGTLAVLFLYLAGVRLFRRRGIAALAALLLAIDGLAFTMSRIAMLDVFLALFVVVGFWLLLVDRDVQWRGVPRRPPDRAERLRLPLRPHWARALAGVAFGLALASKWSALLPLLAAGLFVLVSELLFRRRTTGRWTVQLWRIPVSGLLTLVAVPALVYVLSYAGWFLNYEDTRLGMQHCTTRPCDAPVTQIAGDWIREQGEIARFHRDLEAEHPYRATADTWPTLGRPVAYYYESCEPEKALEECQVGRGQIEEILGIGNPAIWWLALGAYPLLVFFGVRDRDWRAWAILLFLLAQYLPWRWASRPLFLFYMTPDVPFIALALAYVAWRAQAVRFLRWLPLGVAAISIASFLYFYPVLVGLEIPRPAWEQRMWSDRWI